MPIGVGLVDIHLGPDPNRVHGVGIPVLVHDPGSILIHDENVSVHEPVNHDSLEHFALPPNFRFLSILDARDKIVRISTVDLIPRL